MQSKQINLQRIMFIVLVLSLVILYVLSWVDVVYDPAQLMGSDFMAFYAAGSGMFEHSPAAAYDLASLKASEESVLGFQIADQDVNPFVHPSFLLPVLWLVAHFNYVTAFYLWGFFILILGALSAQIAINLFLSATRLNSTVLWAGTFLFFPLFISLVNGQDSALLLLGAMLWYYGFTQNSNRMAGLIILCLVGGKAPAIIDKHVSLAVIVAMFASPHLHYHDLALLIIPILILIRGLITAEKVSLEYAALIPFGVSLVLVFTYSIEPLNYLIIYLIELGLLIFAWLLNKQANLKAPVGS